MSDDIQIKDDFQPKPEKKKRYEVCLAKANDPKCYLTVHRTNSFQEAKDHCQIVADEEEREAVVYDNETFEDPFTFRHNPKHEAEIKEDVPKKSPKWQKKPITRK